MRQLETTHRRACRPAELLALQLPSAGRAVAGAARASRSPGVSGGLAVGLVRGLAGWPSGRRRSCWPSGLPVARAASGLGEEGGQGREGRGVVADRRTVALTTGPSSPLLPSSSSPRDGCRQAGSKASLPIADRLLTRRLAALSATRVKGGSARHPFSAGGRRAEQALALTVPLLPSHRLSDLAEVGRLLADDR